MCPKHAGALLRFHAMQQPLGPAQIRIVPLGGLGEIGMNCLAIEQADGIVVIDCGILFPQDDYGVDVIHPRLDWLVERADRVVGMFVTHAHEDHVGGIPYLLGELDVPVWGSPYALGVIRRRLAEHHFREHELSLRPVCPGERCPVGPFTIEPVRVSHSIVEATALHITTCAGTILHTGDFNFDPDPPDGEPTDVERLRAIGDAGVDLMLSDSTNIEVPERDCTERDVGVELDRLVGGALQRVFVAMFASNVHRMSILGEIAQRHGRRICLLGRSMGNHTDVAQQVGRLRWPSHLLVAPEAARDTPRHTLLVLAGGSQAETNSAMVRLAADVHNHLSVESGDTVVFSSRIIPGNERSVFSLMSALLRKGVDLHSRITNPRVHTSGHAVRSEQERMLRLLRPRAFLPVHGTLHHLRRHAELACELGVPHVLTVENGTTVRFDADRLEVDGFVPHGRVSIADGGEPVDRDTLARRAELGRSGIVTIALVVDGAGRVAAEPGVCAYGVPSVDGDGEALRQVARHVLDAFSRTCSRATEPAVTDAIRRAVRRRLVDLCGCRPVVQVQLSVLDAPEQ